MADFKFYFNELKSDGCMCGARKQPGKSFCWTCWKKLPLELQRALYRRIGSGYEQACDDAHAFLMREGNDGD